MSQEGAIDASATTVEAEEVGAAAQTSRAVVSGELRLDASCGPAPMLTGSDPRAIVVDWTGQGRPDLLVSVAAGAGRRALIVPALEEQADYGLPLYGEAIEVPALAGVIPAGAVAADDGMAVIGFDPTAGIVSVLVDRKEPTSASGSRQVLLSNEALGLGAGHVSHLVLLDWDGDGRADLLIAFDPDSAPSGGASRGRMFWLKNEGQAGLPSFAGPEPIEESAAEKLRLGRDLAFFPVAWGRSRSQELLVADGNGSVRLHRNFGGQLPPVLMEPRPIRSEGGAPFRLGSGRTSIVPADLDGDGRAELLLGRGDGRLFAIRPGSGRDEALAPQALRQQGTRLRLPAGAVVSAADLDGDGDFDFIVGSESGELWMVEGVAEIEREFHFAPPMELEIGGLPYRVAGGASPAIADWKGSNRADLVVTGGSGEVLYFRNNGGAAQPRWDRPEVVRLGGKPLVLPPKVRPAIVRWTSNEHGPDLVAIDDQGFLSVFPRTDLMEVGQPRALFDPSGRAFRLDGAGRLAGGCALWVGPFLGVADRDDLLVGLPRANRHVVAAMCGIAAESLDELPTVLLLENLGDDVFRPRPVFWQGRPLSAGRAGCSPLGADWAGRGQLDLILGSDDGRLIVLPREELSW